MERWEKIYWTVALMFITGMVGLMIVYEQNKSEIAYKMPNGIVCEYERITGRGFGGATHEFYDCTDNKEYINPEYFNEVRSKK